MKRKEVVSLVLLILVLGLGFWQYKNRKYTDKRSRIMLDTIVEISVSSQHKDILPIIEKGFTLVEHYEQKFSEYRDSSLVWTINHSNGHPVDIDAETYELLKYAEQLYKDTDGAFDVTVGTVVNAWDFDNKKVPTETELAEALKYVGFDKIKYNEKEIIVPAGTKLTFGAIAKGYILDRVAEELAKEDIVCGYITTRSSYRSFGAERRIQRVGIQHPRKLNELVSILKLKEQAIGTSGDYQRYFEIDDVRYHHILNAKTGKPVRDVFSVTVIAGNAFIADGLSTAVFVMEPQKAIDYIKSVDNCEAVIYHQDGEEIIALKTLGMKDLLEDEK